MKLPKTAVIEFKNIYERKFSEKLNINEAETKAKNFLELMILITNNKCKKDERNKRNTKRE